MIAAKALVLQGILALTVPVQFPAVNQAKARYAACVERAFILQHFDEFVRHGNIAAAVEAAFADCRAEENAFVGIVALGTMIPGDAIHGQLLARGAVDRFKATYKAEMMAPFLDAMKPAQKR